MKVLVACEFSGVVRDAFLSRGHEAYSCDLLPSEDNKYHIQRDVRDVVLWTQGGLWRNKRSEWDLIIAHPPCTALCVSGNRWYSGTKEREEAIKFFELFLNLGCDKVCVENPVGVISTSIRPPDQYIQPWMFGHGETKKTGLWLKGLSLLTPTDIVEGREQRIWKMPPSKDRGYLRSITYKGIAQAMAEQWG